MLYCTEYFTLLLVYNQIESIDMTQATKKAVGFDKKTIDEANDSKMIEGNFKIEATSMFSNLKEIQKSINDWNVIE